MGERAAENEFDVMLPDTGPAIDKDPLPEHCQYQDEGCELAVSCLNCPFEECIYERPGGKRRWMKEGRSAEMARLLNEEKITLREIAARFDVSVRTVQRDLKTVRDEKDRRNNHDGTI